MEPKLLTEAEWERISAPLGLTSTIDQIASALRERGLIAQEPVDPLLEEAEALHQDWIARKHKDAIAMLIAALRRGMELGRSDPVRPPLTREMVREAAHSAIRICDTLLGLEDFHSDASQHDKDNLNGFLDRLHAALTDGGRDA